MSSNDYAWLTEPVSQDKIDEVVNVNYHQALVDAMIASMNNTYESIMANGFWNEYQKRKIIMAKTPSRKKVLWRRFKGRK